MHTLAGRHPAKYAIMDKSNAVRQANGLAPKAVSTSSLIKLLV